MSINFGFATWAKLARWAEEIPMLCAIVFLTALGLIVIFFTDGQ